MSGAGLQLQANHALDCLNESWARKVNCSENVRDGLRRCGWDPKTEEEYAVDWAMSGEDVRQTLTVGFTSTILRVLCKARCPISVHDVWHDLLLKLSAHTFVG